MLPVKQLSFGFGKNGGEATKVAGFAAIGNGFQVFEISTVGDADTSDLTLVIIATEIDVENIKTILTKLKTNGSLLIEVNAMAKMIRMICQNMHRYKQRKAFPKCQNRQFSYGKLAVLEKAGIMDTIACVSWGDVTAL